MNRFLLFSLLGGLCLLAACSASLVLGQSATPAYPTPTTFPYFSLETPQSKQATPTKMFGEFSITRQPTITPLPTPSSAPKTEALKQEMVEKKVYSDSFRAGWQIYTPENIMRVNEQSKSAAHSGEYAIAVMPQIERGKVYIVQGKSGSEVYPRDQVIGVSLWLYSGEQDLQLHDLALTAIGSNVLTYFDPDDFSVEETAPYEETFLTYLGFNSAIPARTWAEVTIWLNEMLYDPDYRYLTGLYITNRRGFTRTFYIDDVELILKPGEFEDTGRSVPRPKQPAE